MEMDGSVSYVHSTGALICVLASFLAAIVSYLALRSRRRANLRRINHGSGSTSAPLCKVCHQHVKNAPLQGDGTKEGMCSACNGCSHSAEASPDAYDVDQSASAESDLEIQHTLGSLAIGHTDTPQSRDSPRSWLHLIEDLDLLHDQASNQNNSPHEANHKSKSAADFNISQPQPNVISTASDLEKSNMADGCPRKPLIQPAKLRVRKRRFSISSATAALSLTGNGWSFGDHVINKANGHSVNSEAPNPFLQVPDTTHSRGMNVRRNSAIIERPRVNYFQQRRTNHHSLAHFANGIGLTNHKHNTSQDSCKILSLSRLNHFNSHTTPPPNNQPWQQQSLSSSLISSSHLPCPSNQLQSTGTPAAAVNSRPRSNRVRCVVVALVLFSVTGNVVLLLLLIMHVYKPNSQALSPVWADALSNL